MLMPTYEVGWIRDVGMKQFNALLCYYPASRILTLQSSGKLYSHDDIHLRLKTEYSNFPDINKGEPSVKMHAKERRVIFDLVLLLPVMIHL